MADRKVSSSKKKANRLTLERLKGKKLKSEVVELVFEDETFSWEFKAIPSNRLDALQTRFPPTKEQKARGLSYNPEKFAPALVAACSVEPVITDEDAKEMWESEEWTTGELNSIFSTCLGLCMGGFEVPPTESD